MADDRDLTTFPNPSGQLDTAHKVLENIVVDVRVSIKDR
jgi:hypothetical protein